MSFVFYDTETTGTETLFDQVLQFAAILTDNDMVEIERFEIRSRILPHLVASPGAMSVTGVTAAQLDEPSYPSHYEMVCRIHEKLTSWQPTQFVGHNSIKFDEVFLRSAFYKNLLPVYLTNTNGNSRLDSLKMLRSASLYEPEAINYPTNSKGKLSFKLDQLAPANGFNHANAHEAMSDVEATIFMCQKIRDTAPDTWSRFMRFSQKSAALDFCESNSVIGLTEYYFGKPSTYLLHQIGINPEDKNSILTVDLSYDPEMLANCSDKKLTSYITGSPKLVKKIKANALPGLIDGDDAHTFSKLSSMDYQEIEARAEIFSQDKNIKNRLVSAYLENLPDYPISEHVEKNLYSGFPSNQDQKYMAEFHGVEWPARYDIVCKIQDERYRELGEWLIYCEAPHCLTRKRQHYWTSFLTKRLTGQEKPEKVLSLPEAIQQYKEMAATSDDSQYSLLADHKQRLINQLQSLQKA